MKKWVIAPLMALLCAPMVARAEDDRLFRERVAPILERRCVSCHGDASPEGKLALTTAGAMRAGGVSGPALVPGEAEESLLLEMVSGDEPEMPRKGEPLSAEEVASLRSWIERGRALARRGHAQGSQVRGGDVVGLPAPGAPPGPRGQDRGMGPHPRRCLHLAGARAEGARPRPRGGPADADPPPDVRPARPAADAGGGRRLRRRHRPGRLREAGRSPARLAALRRALGPALARRRPLRRHARLRQGQAPRPRLAVPRLRHPRPSTTTSRTAGSSASSSPATCCCPDDPDGVDRHRASSPPGRGTSSATSSSARGRSTRRRRGCSTATTWWPTRIVDVREPDRRLRPLPRPQVRPDPAGGLLPPPGRLRRGRPRRPRLDADPRGRSAWRRRKQEVEPHAARRCSSKADAATGPELARIDAELAALQGPARDAAGAVGVRASPTQRLPQRDRAEARRRASGCRSTSAARVPHRRGPPRPGPARPTSPTRPASASRSASGSTLSDDADVRPGRNARRPHRRRLRQPGRRGRRPPGRRHERPATSA